MFKEELGEDADGVIRVSNLVSDGSWIRKDLVVIAAGLALVAEEVDLVKVLLNELEAVGLVPAFGEHIE